MSDQTQEEPTTDDETDGVRVSFTLTGLAADLWRATQPHLTQDNGQPATATILAKNLFVAWLRENAPLE